MHETKRFTAKSDIGEIYTIIEFQDTIDVGHYQDPNASIPERRILLQTSEGDTVTPLDAETFKIIETDQIVRKIG